MTTEERLAKQGERACEWCSELIKLDALLCPHCHKWRKDIQRDYNFLWGSKIFHISMQLTIGLLVIAGLASGCWRPQGGESMWVAFFGSASGILLAVFFLLFAVSGTVCNWFLASKIRTKTGMRPKAWWF